MLGVSAGIRPRRGGRASALVLTLLLICGYYMLLLVGIRLAQQGLLHPAVGVWAANIITTIFAVTLFRRVEHGGKQSYFSRMWDALATKRASARSAAAPAPANGAVNGGTMNAPVSIARVSSLGRKVAQKAGMNGFPPVSYTHLDVYKRQVRLYASGVDRFLGNNSRARPARRPLSRSAFSRHAANSALGAGHGLFATLTSRPSRGPSAVPSHRERRTRTVPRAPPVRD